MPKPNLRPVCEQAHFQAVGHRIRQQATGYGFIPLADPDRVVVQKAAHSPRLTDRGREARHLLRNTTHMRTPTHQDASYDPGKVAQPCDPLLRAQLSNPLQPGMIYAVDRHISPSDRLFSQNYPTPEWKLLVNLALSNCQVANLPRCATKSTVRKHIMPGRVLRPFGKL